MSWPDRARLSDHFSATSEAGREADQSHEVRHCADRRHRLKIQRLQAGRVTPYTQTSISAEGAARPATRPNRAVYQYLFVQRSMTTWQPQSQSHCALQAIWEIVIQL